MSAFEVSKEGLAKLLARKGKGFMVLELLQNAFDEEGVTEVEVTIRPSDNYRGHFRIKVEDNSPEGFHDLSHAYTLFAESRKKANPEQRGKWNLGDKLVIASCKWAQIRTTKGTVTFEGDKRTHSRARTSEGTIFMGEVKMTQAEAVEATGMAWTVLVPEGIELTINREAVDCRPRACFADLTLPTEIADDEGYLRPTKRKTVLSVFNPREDEVPHLYEMGIPVVPIDCDWHVDIQQKIPLNFDRDNVTPAYLRTVLTAVVNLLHHELDQEQAAKPWVGEALGSKDITSEAVISIVTAKHGDKRVSYDPSDQEGTKIAVTRGYEVVHGGNYTSEQWENIRRSDAILPAGQVTPSPKPFHPGGKPLKVINPEDWTEGHRDFVYYAKKLASELLDIPLDVVLTDDRGWKFSAAFGGKRLTVSVCGKDGWFQRSKMARHQVDIDRLLIHEFSHFYVSDHLSNGFHEQCCRLGAELVKLARAGKV